MADLFDELAERQSAPAPSGDLFDELEATAPDTLNLPPVTVTPELPYAPIPGVRSYDPQGVGVPQATRRGYADLSSTLGSIAGYAGERFDSDLLRDQGAAMRDYWSGVAADNPLSPQAQVSPFDDPGVLADPTWYTENLARMGPSFVGPLGVAGAVGKGTLAALPGYQKLATLLGVGAGGTFGGALEGAQTYEEGLAGGQDEPTAARAGEAMAAGTAALNALPLHKILNPSARGAIYNFLSRGLMEGVTESAEEPLDEIIQGLAYDKPTDWEDVARRAAHVFPSAFLLGGGAGVSNLRAPSEQAGETGRAPGPDLFDEAATVGDFTGQSTAEAARGTRSAQAPQLEGPAAQPAPEQAPVVDPLTSAIQATAVQPQEATPVQPEQAPTAPPPQAAPVVPEAPTVPQAAPPAPEPAPDVQRSQQPPVQRPATPSQPPAPPAQPARPVEVPQPPSQPPPAPAGLSVPGDAVTVFTPDNQPVETRYEVVEAEDLIASHGPDGRANPAFPADRQPRQRDRAASQTQIQSIARSLNPALLEQSPTTDTGAPIVDAQNIVESGNGRVAAIQLAAREGNAQVLKDYLQQNAARFGIDPQAVAGMRNPVLVRRRLTELDAAGQQEFARASNVSSAARLAPAEQARVDAQQLTDEDLALFEPAEDGNVLAASNRTFVNRFLERVGSTEAAALVDPEGRPNRDAVARMQAAVFQKAYGNDELVQLAAEDADPDVRNILGALQQAAPAFARARSVNDGETGRITGPVIEGIQLFRQAKRARQNVDEFLSQQGLFADSSSEAAAIASFIGANTRSAKAMGRAFREMAGLIENELVRAQNISLFEGLETTPEEIITHGIETARQERAEGQAAGQRGLFEPPSGQASEERAAFGRGEGEPRQGRRRAGSRVSDEVSELGPAPFEVHLDGEASQIRERGVSAGEPAPDVDAAGPIQLDIFSPQEQAATTRRTNQAPPVVQDARVGTFAVGIDRVTSPSDAAHVFAQTRKAAQENLMVLVTDASGVPLSLQRMHIGTLDSASVSPYLVLASAANVEGAETVWFAHNHPSGSTQQSAADRQLTATLTDGAAVLGLSSKGMIVVGPGNRNFTHYATNANAHTAEEGVMAEGRAQQRIPAAARTRRQIPVTERRLRRVPKKDTFPLTSPDTARMYVIAKGGGEGMIFLDNKHLPIAYSEVPGIGDLTTQQLARELARSERYNAAAVVVVHGGVASDLGFRSKIRKAADALKDLRVLDVLEMSDGSITSYTERGLMEPAADYHQVAGHEIREDARDERAGDYAQGPLRQPVNDFVELFRRADAEHAAFDRSIRDAAGALGGRAVVAPVKGRPRAREKIDADYDGDVSQLKDVLRATIAFETDADVNEALERLGDHVEIAERKRNLWEAGAEPVPGGYRDALVLLRTDGGLIAELQLNTEAMMEAKEQAHPLYERYRTIWSNEKLAGHEPPRPKAQRRIEELVNEQMEIYAEAEARSRRTASTRESQRSRETGEPFQRADAGLNERGGSVSNAQAIEAADEGSSSATGTSSTSRNTVDSGSASIEGGEAFAISDTSTENIPKTGPKNQRGFVRSRPLNDIEAAQRKRFARIERVMISKLSKIGMARDVPDAYRKMLRRYRASLQKAAREAEEVVKQKDVLSAEHRQMISDVIEGELKAGIIPPEHVQAIAAQMQQAVTSQTEELIRLGMLSRQTAERWRGKYLPRFYAKTEKPVPRAMRRQFMKIDGNHLKGRGQFEMVQKRDIENYKALGWEIRDPESDTQEVIGKLRDNDKVLMWRDYTRAEREAMGEIRDAVYRFARGHMEASRDIALGRLFKAIAESEHASPRQTHEDQVEVPDTKIPGTGGVKRYGALAGQWVHKDIWNDLEAIREPGGEVWRQYMRGLSFWKEGKTALNPVVHSNNVWSSWIMADLYGISPWNVKAYRATLKDYTGKGPFYQEAIEHGLFGTEFYGQEIRQVASELAEFENLEKAAAGKLRRMIDYGARFSGARKYRNGMGRLYRAEDQFFKLLIYRDMREKGATIDEAIDEAERWIFNYADLPRGARAIKNSPLGLPFFSYTFKAAPALAYAAFTAPWRFAKWIALFGGFNYIAFSALFGPDHEEREEEERRVMPDYMKGMTPFLVDKAMRWPYDRRPGVATYMDLSRRFPMGDMFDMENQMGGAPIPQPLMPNNPVFTTALAMFANKDSFTGRDITRDSDTLERAVKKKSEWLLYQALPNTPLLPFSYSFDKVMSGVAHEMGEPVRLVPGVKEYTGLNFHGEEQTLSRAIGSTTFGFKIREFDIEREARYANREFKTTLDDLRFQIKSKARDQSLTEAVRQRQIADLREQIDELVRKHRAE